MAQCLVEIRGSFQTPRPVESHRIHLIPATNCDNMGEMVPTNGDPKILMLRDFLCGLVR